QGQLGSTLLSILLVSRLSKSIHVLTMFGMGLVLGGGAGPRGGGREKQLFSQMAVIRPPPPLTPGLTAGRETTALPQHYCDSHQLLVHNLPLLPVSP
uniref:Uncharacterized protein n=1 Tax=Neovison vison TaxID=452646 RepID=A0A8C7B0U4_NEOVI